MAVTISSLGVGRIKYKWLDFEDHGALGCFYSSVNYRGAVKHSDLVVVAEADKKIIGAARLACENGKWVLRGFYVDVNYQRLGIGEKLLKILENAMNQTEVFCLASSQGLSSFKKLSFAEINPEALPEHLRSRLAEYKSRGFEVTPMKRPAIRRPSMELLNECLKLWGLKGQPLFIRNNENCVYSLTQDEVILRFTEPGHRSFDELSGELLWIEALCKNCAKSNFSGPLKSQGGSLVEKLNGESEAYFVSVFEKATGVPLVEARQYSPEVYRNLGQVIGQMHGFERQNKQTFARREWSSDLGFVAAKKSADPSDGKPYEIFNGALDWLQGLPKDESCYGLVHSDIHQGNFFVGADNEITLFDFDDGQRHWFAYDLAVPLFSMDSQNFGSPITATIFEDCKRAMLEAYLAEYPLAASWVEKLPLFITFRRILLFYWGKSRLGSCELEPEVQIKIKKMMDNCLQSLESFEGFPKSIATRGNLDD